ncbi:MAG: hypothetical protein IT289_08965 [Oligoflexia bacterium]|nr:hypothetical protein [Oligoflexia bacterium]
MTRIKYLLVLLLGLVLGCSKACQSDPYKDLKSTPMDMRLFEEDLIVPTSLWQVMESSYRPLALDAEGQAIKETAEEGEKPGEEANPNEPKEELLKKRPPLDPISFKAILVEKTKGVLGDQNYELKYPKGGGLLDYRYFVPETRQGSFYLYVSFDEEMNPKDTRVYYLSNAKIRDVDGKAMGNGCNRYFDITDYWFNSMNEGGLLLNTVKNRHISVTAGTLYFVAPVKGKLRISHLTIRDGRHRELMCTGESH